MLVVLFHRLMHGTECDFVIAIFRCAERVIRCSGPIQPECFTIVLPHCRGHLLVLCLKPNCRYRVVPPFWIHLVVVLCVVESALLLIIHGQPAGCIPGYIQFAKIFFMYCFLFLAVFFRLSTTIQFFVIAVFPLFATCQTRVHVRYEVLVGDASNGPTQVLRRRLRDSIKPFTFKRKCNPSYG